jgi:hypothetical protein
MKKIALALAAVGALALAAPSFAQTSVNTGTTVKSGAAGTNLNAGANAGANTTAGGANANVGANAGMKKSGMKARAQAATHVKHGKHAKRHTPSATVGAGGSAK